MKFDKRFIYITIALVAIYVLSPYFTSKEGFVSLLIMIPGLLIAITFHEFAHAWVATLLGDPTPKEQGRLSLNPLAHLDLLGCLMLLTIGMGWGKPVSISPEKFKKKVSMKWGTALVSLAGPAMNFLIAFIFVAIYYAIVLFATDFAVSNNVGQIIIKIIAGIISINIGLGVFNLIPLPPLDGSKIVMAFLPEKANEWIYRNYFIFQIIFLVLWATDILTRFITPIIYVVIEGMQGFILSIFQLFM